MLEQYTRRGGSDRVWTVAVGAGVGLAAGLLLAQGRKRRRKAAPAGMLEQRLAGLEDRVVDALLEDEVLSRRAIEVAALTEGIVELTGTVETEEEADQATARAQTARGVRTVLNRLDLQPLEEHLEETRHRYEEGDPSLHEAGWTGMQVGMGQRRQSGDTEPDRRDDKVPMIERELGVARATESASEELDKVAPAVEGHSTGPAGPTDHGLVDEESHHRTGNVPRDDQQDRNPSAWLHENVKTGTELDIEESGEADELEESDARERG